MTKIFNKANVLGRLSFVVLILVVAVGGVKLIGWSHADTIQPTDQIQYQPSCNAAPIGYATCDSLIRTDNTALSSKPLKPLTHSPNEPEKFNTTPSSSIGNDGGYDPAFLQAAYNVTDSSSTNGKGTIVAVVDSYADPTADSDLAEYRSLWNLPPCTVANGCLHIVNQEGLPSTAVTVNQGWQLETNLDLDMVSAMCPNCQIVQVEANSNSIADLSAADQTAYDYGASVISNSYSASEGTSTYPDYTVADTNDFNHPGIAITAATGDGGYDVAYPGATAGQTSYPGVLPEVTAVGGTTLNQSAGTTTRQATETMWQYTGGGCSLTQSKPSWQKDTGCTNRTIADVSADADQSTPVWIYNNGNWELAGGTSVATPIVAGIIALEPQQYNYSPSYPYANSSSFNDITSDTNGSNSPTGCTILYLCNAEVGYDAPTGVGSPNGLAGFASTSTEDLPSVSITTPSEGTNEISGNFTVSGTASDPSSSISSVAISVDDGAYSAVSGTTNWSTSLNASDMSFGLHKITIQATNSAGNTSISSIGIIVGSIIYPSTPTGVTGTAVSSSQINLSWQPSTDSGSSIAYYEVSENGNLSFTTTSTSFSVTGLQPNFSYYFTVTAVATNGLSSSPSAAENVSTLPIPGNPPTAPVLSLDSVNDNSITLSWTASKSTIGISSYEITESFVGKGGSSNVNGLTATFVAKPNSTATYSVVAVDLNGTSSPPSNSVTVTTPATNTNPPPSVPAGLTAQVVSYKQVNLTWKPSTGGVDGVLSYSVYRNNLLFGLVLNTNIKNNIPSFSDATTSPLTKYSYYLTATDYAGDESAPSARVSITTPAIYKVSELKGHITNSKTNANLSGVTVTATSSNDAVSATTTNSKGNYAVFDLSSGLSKVVFSAKGYKTQTVKLILGETSVKIYNLKLVKN